MSALSVAVDDPRRRRHALEKVYFNRHRRLLSRHLYDEIGSTAA
jgi:hypothetical protein